MPERAGAPRRLRATLIALCGLLLSGALLLYATAPEPGDPGAQDAAAASALEVSSLRVELRTLRPSVSLAGVLRPRRAVGLYAETRGRVVELGAEDLDAVEAGQLLVHVDPLLAEVEVERATAALARTGSELELARSTLARRRSLVERNVASEAALDDAENASRIAAAAVREARAALAAARDQLAKKTVRAPFAGVLRSFPLEVGEYVHEGERLGELLDLVTARMVVGLSDRAIVSLHPGDPVRVRVEAYPLREFAGSVLRVGAAASTENKKFPVEIEIPNDDGRLLPGMIARAEIEVGEEASMALIPLEAARDEFGLRFVFVLEAAPVDGQVIARRRRVEVRELPFRPGELEVLQGLEEGDEIAITGLRQLRDGQRVRRAGGGTS